MRHDRGRVIAGRKHSEHMFHGKPPAANDRFPVENLRIKNNAIDQLLFGHGNSACFCGLSIGVMENNTTVDRLAAR
jgi:hypothetical protein